MTTAMQEQLSLQEKALAHAMLYRVGSATVHFALDGSGDRMHTLPDFTGDDFNRLTDSFATDPKEALAYARESLFAISTDTRLHESSRRRRLDRYTDAYINLTLRLDHAAFPESGTPRRGIPAYIPDGLVDLGKYATVAEARQHREQVWIDKRAILEKYKPVLTQIFAQDYSRASSTQKKLYMANELAKAVYFGMPFAKAGKTGKAFLGTDRVRLSELDEGVCRHQSLVFQVLGQAVGLTIRTVKGDMQYFDQDLGKKIQMRHATNIMRVNGQWYLYDVTNPDHMPLPDGVKEWRPGRHEIDGPPTDATTFKVVKTKGKHGGLEFTYWLRGTSDTYWFIEHPRS
jgi:transglutaminase-like putative cysteine protease